MSDNSIELQKRFLAGLKDTSKGKKVYRWFNPDMLDGDRFKALGHAMLKSYRRSGVAPSKSAAYALAKRKAPHLNGELTELTDEVYDTDVDDWEVVAELVGINSRTKAVDNSLVQAKRAIDENGDFDLAKNVIEKAFQVGNVAEGVRVSLDDPRPEKIREGIIPTMISTLDKELDGGLAAGELGVVMAPPSGGKSALLVNFGAGAAMAGKRVLHWTLELGPHRTADRYRMRIMGVTQDELGNKEHAGIAKKVQGNVDIEFYPTKSVGVSHLESVLNSEEIKPNLVIVDYADLLSAGRNVNTSENRFVLSDIYANLRRLAGTHEIPIWTASQTNRRGAGEGPMSMTDVQECWDKMAITDIVIGWKQDETEYETGVGRASVLKFRDGGRGGTVPCNADYERMTITSFKNSLGKEE